ncbi:BTAD domain-containing putative transcriptional regulator [Agromyces mediolanus]|uniref:SARP family transcriptional regulator n=1 Tax=Agromyces mediolanus TaxID=41986 RepID=A0A918FH03_AGRME|nr:BTAD domain-containing putative transcriptional regulator [Agromyces mediolanus]GGR37163.1 SARP family transcriptional regulator [Agromyces mediolanus]GLJ73964.1 SARP family transcriptional regulator [Agromyces mediolanus]
MLNADRTGEGAPSVGVLGPVVVADASGCLVEPPGALAKALVAVLVAIPRRPGDVVGIDTIVDELWGDAPPRHPRAALQTLVSRVRRLAPELIRSSPAGYALAIGPSTVDLAAAELAAEPGDPGGEEAGDAGAELRAVDAVLARWRGEPGEDLGGAPVADALAARAATARERLLRRRAELLAAGGTAHDETAEAYAALSQRHPLDEAAVAGRLEALAAAGRRAEALAEYAAFRERLAEELGVDPSPALVEVHARLLREPPPTGETGAGTGAAASAPASAPAPPLTGGIRLGLRAAPNPLLGRDDDVRDVERLLHEHRLVTVLGAGGLGKTRLAQAVAARFPAPSVVVVELAGVRDDDDIELALGSALALREARSARLADAASRPELRQRIEARLGEAPTLLVLDNCEQIIDGAARWAAELLAAAPELTILATSRSPLAIGAERVVPLAPLAVREGAAIGPAGRLFRDRALAVRPDAALPDDVVDRLCARLDGLPLAIELAAARVRSMSVAEIEARLDNRFALLSNGDRSAPERQRTLEAVIEWSWALLDEAEQHGLARLSWFADGFGVDAAEVVLGHDALRVLDGLVAQSLLTVRENGDGAARYRMLETVREFGQLRLEQEGGTAAARDAMARWAEQLSELPFVGGGETQLLALRRLRVEEENLVEVLRRAIAEERVPTVLRVYAALAYFWSVRSAHAEVMTFGRAALAATRHGARGPELAVPALLTAVFAAATAMAYDASTGARALARLKAHARDGWPVPGWLRGVAGFLEAPDLERALERLVAMSESEDGPTALVGALLRTQFEENAGDPEAAAEHAQQAHVLARRVGDIWAESMSSMMLAQLASQTGRPEAALRWAAAAEAELRLLDSEPGLVQLEWMRAGNLLSAGRLDEARPLIAEFASSERRTADGLGLATVGELGLSELARAEGRMADAAHHARTAAESFGPAERSSPWYLMVLADLVSAAAHDERDAADAAFWAARLRYRTLGMRRAWGSFNDKPVLGTAALGWSAWAIRQPGLRERGLELLALAERLRARQDLPGLRIATHLADAEALVGRAALEGARSAAAALDPEARMARAHELFVLPLPSAGPGV